MSPLLRPSAEALWLHQGGSAARWGSLGLWQSVEDSYAQACTALASAVALAAGLQAGHNVLSVGCGAGEELQLWRQRFGAAWVVGIEADARFAGFSNGSSMGLAADVDVDVAAEEQAKAETDANANANANANAATSHQTRKSEPVILFGSGTRLMNVPSLKGARFDCVLCVDAAYHFHPRIDFLQGAWHLLRPGGRLAYTDLVLQPECTAPGRMAGRKAWKAAWQSAVVRRSAQLCGVPTQDLLSLALHTKKLRDAGFEGLRATALDEQVLDGFAAFVRRKPGRWRRAAWRPALTAALIPACRDAGLGYALLSAVKPLGNPNG